MDVEREFRRVLGKLPAEVYIDVPETRPAEFYSVELTATTTAHGGALSTSTIAVQCWAGTRERARELFDALAARLPSICYAGGAIGSATLEGGYRFDDLESGTPRYQALIQITY